MTLFRIIKSFTHVPNIKVNSNQLARVIEYEFDHLKVAMICLVYSFSAIYGKNQNTWGKWKMKKKKKKQSVNNIWGEFSSFVKQFWGNLKNSHLYKKISVNR